MNKAARVHLIIHHWPQTSWKVKVKVIVKVSSRLSEPAPCFDLFWPVSEVGLS
jgi:hypothetical protein